MLPRQKENSFCFFHLVHAFVVFLIRLSFNSFLLRFASLATEFIVYSKLRKLTMGIWNALCTAAHLFGAKMPFVPEKAGTRPVQ